jgi:hypothetical protein
MRVCPLELLWESTKYEIYHSCGEESGVDCWLELLQEG